MNRPVATLEMETQTPSADAGFGALETVQGRLPLVAMEVRAIVQDVTAQTTVRQTFRNSYSQPLEATYIFPLPDRAAVTAFEMHVAGRTIEGLLQERAAAREEYDQAIQKGHRAAIAEEERSGVFTMRVGNLPPGEDATITLQLVGPLPVSQGEVTYRFPLVVAPRYTPGIPLDGPAVGQGTSPDTNQVPDASRVTPPVLLPGFPNPVQLSLEVQLDSPRLAHNPAALQCSLHAFLVDQAQPLTVRLHPGERLNRDFILRFPIAGETISTSLRTAAQDGSQPSLFALNLLPPAGLPSGLRPREIIFVLDRSGSMAGWKMVCARRALARLIDSLLDQDRFTVLAFDTAIETPPAAAGGLLTGSDRHRWQAQEWLSKIEARGGTEMGPALTSAVRQVSSSGGTDRIIVLITDGQVTGEDAVLKQLHQEAQGRWPRIFTVGIDRAVNAGFLRKLADAGGSHCELIESEDRLDAVLTSMHRLIGQPVLKNIRLELQTGDLVAGSLAPARLPDLYPDRPVTILGRVFGSQPLLVRVHATCADGTAFVQDIGAVPGERRTLLSLWGRAHIRDLEDRYATIHAGEQAALAKQIVATSIECHVLSRFTAYVAVDRAEVVNPGGTQHQVLQPVDLAEGWQAFAHGTAASALSCYAAPAGGKNMLGRMLGGAVSLFRSIAPESTPESRGVTPAKRKMAPRSAAPGGPPNSPIEKGGAARESGEAEIVDFMLYDSATVTPQPGPGDTGCLDGQLAAPADSSNESDKKPPEAGEKLASRLSDIERAEDALRRLRRKDQKQSDAGPAALEAIRQALRQAMDRGATHVEWSAGQPGQVRVKISGRFTKLSDLPDELYREIIAVLRNHEGIARTPQGKVAIPLLDGRVAICEIVFTQHPLGETAVVTILETQMLTPATEHSNPAAPRTKFWA